MHLLFPATGQAGGYHFAVGWNDIIALKLSYKINFSVGSIESEN
jgi:hypothetical protein